MKPLKAFIVALLLATLCNNTTTAQNYGTLGSAVFISNCNQNAYYNTSGPGANPFNNTNLGIYSQGTGSLVLRGAQVSTFKDAAASNVCAVRLFYRVYLQSATPGAFNVIDLPFFENCNAGNWPSGGACNAGDQKWQRVINDGETIPFAPVDLTTYAPGNYTLEVYYEVDGSQTTTTLCNDLVTLNNGGAFYRASFTVQNPDLLFSTNPTTCNGSEGSIVFSGLASNTSYQVTYLDDGITRGPVTVNSNAAGQATITGLNAGLYTTFVFTVNGCSTDILTGVILSNPIFVPSFNPVASFCQGNAAPVLPATSNNGIPGTWSPTPVSNQSSGLYTFTPRANTCAIPVNRSVTVIQRVTAVFSFGTSLTICGNAAVPTLPNTSLNGINGTWSPAVVSNTNSGTYTFTPSGTGCVQGTTFTVTVNPNLPPFFNFSNYDNSCAGDAVPSLPGTSLNGITGTWNPAVVSNTTSGVYNFTPTPGQCALPFTYTHDVFNRTAPVFSFGNSLTICRGGAVPALPTTSTNGLTGTWTPAVVSNTTSGTYTWESNTNPCAPIFTYTVTVNQINTPTFSFGNSAMLCLGDAVPVLPATSTNGISGTWSPAVVSGTTSGTYTFTPTSDLCAPPVTFNVTVNPVAPPVFTFGNSLNICTGNPVPALPNTSNNGITGTWSPAVVSNTTSGTYTFTAGSNPCLAPYTFTVTVYQVITPTFTFGNSIDICTGTTPPVLPTTSTNGLTGTWSPATISNTTSGAYTFTSTSNPCAPPVTVNVTVNPVVPATFAIGNSLIICTGGTVPALPAVSSNGVSGTWAPAVVSNTASGVYIFNPGATDPCTPPYIYTVAVNPIVAPGFPFGTSASVCTGTTAPVLPALSSNGITGTWSPAVVSNTTTGTYTFTPNPGQCANTATFNYEVNPVPSITNGSIKDTTVYDGDVLPLYTFTTDNTNAGIRWTNSNSDIGLVAQGTGVVPSFKAKNITDAAIAGVVTATPYLNGCNGSARVYRIIVLPLDKDVFVPNVFSPNNDGKNDLLLVYGNYIASLELQIFNQWGQHIITLNNKGQGWDGRFKGKPQPVGVYMYVLKAVLTDGRKINKKGSITLLR